MRIGILIVLAGSQFLNPVDVHAGDLTGSVPRRFVEDTIYHVALSLGENSMTVSYGRIPLVTCSIEPCESALAVGGFASAWEIRSPSGWQSVTSRQALSSRESISDTVVEVVARVSNADPQQIQRIMPDRFRIDLSGDFQLVVVTTKGRDEGESGSETIQTTVRRLLSLGRLRVWTMLVSERDAQTLYYALEPGTPVILLGDEITRTLSIVPSDTP